MDHFFSISIQSCFFQSIIFDTFLWQDLVDLPTRVCQCKGLCLLRWLSTTLSLDLLIWILNFDMPCFTAFTFLALDNKSYSVRIIKAFWNAVLCSCVSLWSDVESNISMSEVDNPKQMENIKQALFWGVWESWWMV